MTRSAPPARAVASLVALALVAGAIAVDAPGARPASATPGRFVDVPANAYFATPVAWLAARGVTTGVDGTRRYEPHRPVTRGEVAAMLWRVQGRPGPAVTGSGFRDVPTGAFYATPVRWMAATGVTTGVDRTRRYEPHRPVTRAEFAAMLHRLEGRPGHTRAAPVFADVRAGAYFAPAVRWMAERRITTGVDGTGRYEPHRPVTRAEVATMLHRLERARRTLPATYVPPRPARVVRALAYGDAAHQRLDLHLPTGPGPHPVLVYLHSGGWCCGSRAQVPEPVLHQLGRGYAIAAVSYQLATLDEPAFPANLHDTQRAIRWLKARGADHGLDPDRIVTIGHSAGGHLATLAALTAAAPDGPDDLPPELAVHDPAVRGAVSLAGFTDLVAFTRVDHPWGAALPAVLLGCPDPGCRRSTLAAASPASHLHAEAPPVFLGVGTEDVLSPPAHATAFHRRYAQEVPGGALRVWVDVAPRAGHNLALEGVDVVLLGAFLDAVVT